MYRGKKISGDGRGKELGFPTVNVELLRSDMKKIFFQNPEGGVFLVKIFLEGTFFSGLLHLGERPTFASRELRVEIFILDFLKNIPENSEICFELYNKIRKIQKFSGKKELIEQIEKDVKSAKKFLGKEQKN